MSRLSIIALTAAMLFTAPASAEDAIEIRIPQRVAIPEYIVPLLELALSKQDRPFSITLPEGTRKMTAVDVMGILTDPMNDQFNLYAAGTSIEYETTALPIRVPLMRGLLGKRILAIPKGTQDRFLKVKELTDLQGMTFLQGIGWGDIAILEGAGLSVKTDRKEILYDLIADNAADAYPRGAVEILTEHRKHAHLDYEIEKEIVLSYDRFPFYFFTGKHNQDLAEIITEGFEKAYADGSFIRFFRTHPMIREIFVELNLEDRRLVRLKNPNLTDETAALPDHYWQSFDGGS